jgi:DNA-binding transcriptional MocR family regulator
MSQHINLQLGWPTHSLFHTAHLLNGASTVLTSQKKAAASLVYGPDPGYGPLRESVAKWLSSIYTLNGAIDSNRICITNGASTNLANVLAKFTEPGYTKIWMIEPSYFLACPIFMDAGHGEHLRGVPEDEEGLDIDFLRTAVGQTKQETQQLVPKLKTGSRYKKLYRHLIYLVPTFSNPSAKTMSLRRREQLLRLAREIDALVVTDDVYDVLRWPVEKSIDLSRLGKIPPRVVDLDRTLDGGPKDKWGNAVSNGSFSKLIAPGCRVGWAESMPSFILALSQVGSTRSGGCPTQLTASFVHEMLQSGALESHIRETAIPTYRSRYYVMMEAIKQHLLPLGFEISVGKPYDASDESLSQINGCAANGTTDRKSHSVHEAGGYFTYLKTPANLPVPLSELAVIGLEKYNLKFAFGDMFQVEGDPTSAKRASQGFGNGVRLCWAWHTESEITEGIQRLVALVKEVRQRHLDLVSSKQ